MDPPSLAYTPMSSLYMFNVLQNMSSVEITDMFCVVSINLFISVKGFMMRGYTLVCRKALSIIPR